MSGNTIKVRTDGPLLCRGEVEIYDADGKLLKKGDDIVLCRCGASRDKPFCDGSHRAAGFEAAGHFSDERGEPLEGEGALTVTCRSHAMLLVKGPVTLLDADGQAVSTRNKAALCRCGHSANKPFCDATHKRIGFSAD